MWGFDDVGIWGCGDLGIWYFTAKVWNLEFIWNLSFGNGKLTVPLKATPLMAIWDLFVIWNLELETWGLFLILLL
ncbi:MAG: hypothetical protein RBR42_13370 [Desulfomicrobium sp.]|jgi:hypothetical protein|nr:hypothetical protein [Desulfomicrobium sp.]